MKEFFLGYLIGFGTIAGCYCMYKAIDWLDRKQYEKNKRKP